MVVIFGVWFRREMLIDGCLDSGGAWDYQRNICVTETGR